MRITNRMMADRSLLNLNATLRRMDRYHQQLSTGKRISMPSDDPSGTERSMRLHTTILETEQYVSTVGEAISWLDSADAALDQASTLLQRARELVVAGANGALPAESREALAVEMDQLVEDLITVGNLKHGIKFVFAGENTLTTPFVGISDPAEYPQNGKGETVGGAPITRVEYRGTTLDPADPLSGIVVEIGGGSTMRISTHGNDALSLAFEALIEARNHLWEGDTQSLSTTDIVKMDEAIDQVLRARSDIGAKSNRLELVRDRLNHLHTNLTKLLSDIEDIDPAEAIMHLKMEETVYRAALASGARIIMPSLLDFLR